MPGACPSTGEVPRASLCLLYLVATQPLQQWLNKHFCCFRLCNRKKQHESEFTDGTINGDQPKIKHLQLKSLWKKGDSRQKNRKISDSDDQRESGLHETFTERNVDFQFAPDHV